MVKYSAFKAPGDNHDFGGDANLRREWTRHMARVFDTTVLSVSNYLAGHTGGVCQFYNPVSHGRAEPDLPAALTDITWNGFPKQYDSPGPGQPPRYADAEAFVAAGRVREQDEYLEWFVNRSGTGRSSPSTSPARPTTTSNSWPSTPRRRCSTSTGPGSVRR
jgi:hypothetical protein